MQAPRQLADLVHCHRELALRTAQELVRGLAAGREPRRCDSERLQGHDQPLLGAVVKIALESAPLGVAGTNEPVVRGAEFALGLPQLGRVTDDRDDLVIVDRDDPRLELALIAADRREHVADRLELARLECPLDRGEQRLCHGGRQQLVHLAADDLFPGVREQLGVADEVDVGAVCRNPEHQVGNRVEQRAHTRFDVRACSGEALVHATRVARYERAPRSQAISESARTSSSVVRKLTKHGRRPTLPSTVAGATHTRPSSCSVRTSRSLCAFRFSAPPRWRNGTIESGGGPHSGSRASSARISSYSSRAWRRLFSTASRNAAAPWARNASQSLSARNGREYSSVMSTMCAALRSWGMYDSSCEKAWKRSSRRRTRRTPHAFGRYNHLWASNVTESTRSSPSKR